MANKDQIIRSQQLEIERLQARIAELESAAYKLELAGIGLAQGMQAIIDRADQDRADLVAQLRERGTLSPKQWNGAVRMLAKYHRQIGPKP